MAIPPLTKPVFISPPYSTMKKAAPYPEKWKEDKWSRKQTFGEIGGEQREELKDRIERYHMRGADIEDVLLEMDKLLDFTVPLKEIPIREKKGLEFPPHFDFSGIKIGVTIEEKKWPKWIGRVLSVLSIFLSLFILFGSVYGLGPVFREWEKSMALGLGLFIHALFILCTALLVMAFTLGSITFIHKKCGSIL